MKLLRALPHTQDFAKGVVATVGNFDGVHLGHQHLIGLLHAQAKKMDLPLVLVLFEPQPREYFQGFQAPARLTSLREKVHHLRQCAVDYVYCVQFTEQLACTSGPDFARQYLFSALGARYLLVGEDFRFGKSREGDIHLLQEIGAEYGCDVQQCLDWCFQHKKVSSTEIRAALKQGNLALAAQFLGRTYSLCGRIVRGAGRGRQWGIPTLNLSLRRRRLALEGVYAVELSIHGQKRVQGVANIGSRPTVDGTQCVLEVHLFDFNQSLYGAMVQVFFLNKMRDEIKFDSVEALIRQIQYDIAAAKDYFASQKQTIIQ